MLKNSVNIGGGNLEYIFHKSDSENSPVLVLLHEGLGCISLWHDFPIALAKITDFSVLVYSRHGYGKSISLGTHFQMYYMHTEALEILPALLNHFNIDKPFLYGHSDGASIALIYAGKASARVSGIIVEAPHVFVEKESLLGVERAKDAFDRGSLKTGLAKHHDHPELIFRAWNNIWLEPTFANWNILDYLPSIKSPILMIQGKDDAYGTLAQLDIIERNVAGPTERVVLENCGHSPHREARRKVLDVVDTFTKQILAN